MTWADELHDQKRAKEEAARRAQIQARMVELVNLVNSMDAVALRAGLVTFIDESDWFIIDHLRVRLMSANSEIGGKTV